MPPLIHASIFRYNNMSYRVDDISWDKCPEDTFTNAKGEAVSYVDYYQNQYNIEIQDRKQPLLISRSRRKGLSEKEVDRIICLIPELCLMTGLTGNLTVLNGLLSLEIYLLPTYSFRCYESRFQSNERSCNHYSSHSGGSC